MREGDHGRDSEADRERPEAIVADRNSPQKHVLRARIALHGGRVGTQRDHAPNSHQQSDCVALAGAVHAGRHRGLLRDTGF